MARYLAAYRIESYLNILVMGSWIISLFVTFAGFGVVNESIGRSFHTFILSLYM